MPPTPPNALQSNPCSTLEISPAETSRGMRLVGQQTSNSRLRALEAIQEENAALKRFLFETYATDQKQQKHEQQLLSSLEKQDRNLEAQLSQVQQYVLDERAKLEEARLAFERHIETHGRAFNAYKTTVECIDRLDRLEDKKHASLVSRGEAEHTSNDVKEKINRTRRERLLFEGMEKKHRKELWRIAHDVARAIEECTERIESTKKSAACIMRLEEVYRTEEEAWTAGWREQLLRMEAFTENERKSQMQRVEEKRQRAVQLLRDGGAEQPLFQGKETAKGKEGFDLSLRIDQVLQHVTKHCGGRGDNGSSTLCCPPHLAIARAFQEVRAQGIAKIKEFKEAENKRGDDEQGLDGSLVHRGAASQTDEVAGKESKEMPPAQPSAKWDNLNKLVRRLCDVMRASVDMPEFPTEHGQGLLTMLGVIELFVLVRTRDARQYIE
jgi:hypothetical protein